jgi:hypothetical protein
MPGCCELGWGLPDYCVVDCWAPDGRVRVDMCRVIVCLFVVCQICVPGCYVRMLRPGINSQEF